MHLYIQQKSSDFSKSLLFILLILLKFYRAEQPWHYLSCVFSKRIITAVGDAVIIDYCTFSQCVQSLNLSYRHILCYLSTLLTFCNYLCDNLIIVSVLILQVLVPFCDNLRRVKGGQKANRNFFFYHIMH